MSFSPDEISRQLKHVLDSPDFQATPMQRAFLKFVVDQKLAGNTHRIKAYTVATEVFGRKSDFDQSIDPIVSIQASRLRRALDQYYQSTGKNDIIRVDIPKGTYVPVFNKQKEFKSEKRSPKDNSIKPGTKDSKPILLIQPFQDLTSDPDQRFFTIGLVEDLVTELSRFQDVVALSCQRLPQTEGMIAGPEELYKNMGARFLLGGIVRKDRATVKVSIYLTDKRSRRQIWAKAYKTQLEASRLISSQEEIARNVVSAVASEYGVIARRLSAESIKKAPSTLSTFEAMMRYYAYMVNQSPLEIESSFGALQQAVKREPEYGPTWSALADFYCDAYAFDTPNFDRPLENAMHYARRGASLEPGFQIGRRILAYALCLAGDRSEFEKEIKAALALNPNSTLTLGYAACCYTFFGEFTRGRSLMNKALEANPYYPSWFHLVSYFDHFRKGEYERALLEFEKYRLNENYWVHVLGIAALGKLNRAVEAKTYIEEINKLKPDFASRARELICRPIKVDTLSDDLIDGLCKGGLLVN